MAHTKDFYAVLGVSASANADEIKKQYRRLAKKWHPDANANDPKAAERFKEISEAYNVLGDAEKRAQYDQMRRLGAFEGFGAPRREGRPGSRPGASSAGGGSTFNFEDVDLGGLGGFGGIGDLFGSIFGQSAKGTRPKGPEQGQSFES